MLLVTIASRRCASVDGRLGRSRGFRALHTSGVAGAPFRGRRDPQVPPSHASRHRQSCAAYGTLPRSPLRLRVVADTSSLFRSGDNCHLPSWRRLIAVLFLPRRERSSAPSIGALTGTDIAYAVVRLGRRLEATLASDALIEAVVCTVRESLTSFAACPRCVSVRNHRAAASGITSRSRSDPPPSSARSSALLVSPRREEPHPPTAVIDDSRQSGSSSSGALRPSCDKRTTAPLATRRACGARERRAATHSSRPPRLASVPGSRALTLHLEAARDRLRARPE